MVWGDGGGGGVGERKGDPKLVKLRKSCHHLPRHVYPQHAHLILGTCSHSITCASFYVINALLLYSGLVAV